MFSAAQILKCEFAPPCFRGGPHLGQLLHFSAWVIFSFLYFAPTYNDYFLEYCFSLLCCFFLELIFLGFHFVRCGIRSASFLIFYLFISFLPGFLSPFRYRSGFVVYGGLSVHVPLVGLYGGFLPPPYSIGGASAAVIAVPFHARYLIRIQVNSVNLSHYLFAAIFYGLRKPA